MRFPAEIVVEEFLPTLRSMLAEDLRERGLTQSEVAATLGISQSAVSKYAHGDVARNDLFLSDPRVERLVERVGAGLADGEMSDVEALGEVQALIRRLEDRDLICQVHEAQMPSLEGLGCDFCIRGYDSQLRAEERVLSSIRRGIRLLETASGFTGLIPNVGSNLCECLPDADGIDDVAGVPGRIFDVKGRATIPAQPEFGVSEHVARVLLAARRHRDVRAALNVAYRPELVEALAARGYETAEFDAEYEDLDAAIDAAFAANPDAQVVYQTGGYGIEPITYLLGEDAEAVSELARSLL